MIRMFDEVWFKMPRAESQEWVRGLLVGVTSKGGYIVRYHDNDIRVATCNVLPLSHFN